MATQGEVKGEHEEHGVPPTFQICFCVTVGGVAYSAVTKRPALGSSQTAVCLSVCPPSSTIDPVSLDSVFEGKGENRLEVWRWISRLRSLRHPLLSPTLLAGGSERDTCRDAISLRGRKELGGSGSSAWMDLSYESTLTHTTETRPSQENLQKEQWWVKVGGDTASTTLSNYMDPQYNTH